MLSRVQQSATAGVFGFLCKRNVFLNLDLTKGKNQMFITNTVQIQRFASAMFGIQVGSTTMGQINADITAAGGLNNALNSYYASSFGSATTAAVAASVSTNLGLTGAAATSATDYITAVLNSTPAASRGAAISGVLNLFANLTADATFGAAATAYNAKVTTAASYTGANNVVAGTSVAANTPFTTNVDALIGTAGNDTFAGTTENFSVLDSVDGGAGVDLLRLSLTADYPAGAAVTNIEQISVSGANADGAAAFATNLTGVTGLTLVEMNAVTDAQGAVISGIATNAAASVKNTNVNATFTFGDAALAGTTDTVALTLNNVTSAVTVALNNTTTVTGSTGPETVAITAAGPVGTSANSVTVSTNATQSPTKVTVAGTSANLTLGTGLTTVATVDMSAATGAITIAGFGSATQSITGGAGNDLIVMAGNYGSTDTVNGGAGVDTLSATGAVLAGISTVNTRISSVETLLISDDLGTTGTTINALNFNDVENIRISDQGTGGAASISVNNLKAATVNNIRFDGDVGASGGAYAFSIVGATQAGSANAVALDLRGGALTTTSGITLNGVESVTIDTTNGTGAKAFNLTDASLTSLVITGGQNVTLSGAALGAMTSVVNASAVTGTAAIAVTLNTSAATGATVTTAGGGDTIIASNLPDVISSGSGNDAITGNAGGDVINVGSGTDNVIITTTTSGSTDSGGFSLGATTSNTVSTLDFDIITGLGASDTITLSSYSTTGATNAGLVTTVVTGSTVATTGGITLADNSIHLIRGTYSAATNSFVGSSTGADALLSYDGASNTGTSDYDAIVLIGAGSNTVSVGLLGVLTLG
jgi:hypothetical protein